MSAALVVRRPQAHSSYPNTLSVPGKRAPGAGSGLQRLDQGLIGTEALEGCFHRAIKPLMIKNCKTGNARDGCSGSVVVCCPRTAETPGSLISWSDGYPGGSYAPQEQRNNATAMPHRRIYGFFLVSFERGSCSYAMDGMRDILKIRRTTYVILGLSSNFDPGLRYGADHTTRLTACGLQASRHPTQSPVQATLQ